MVMSSSFLMVWYLTVLGTVWTEDKKVIVPGNLKCARNNRETQPAGRRTQKRDHSQEPDRGKVGAQLEKQSGKMEKIEVNMKQLCGCWKGPFSPGVGRSRKVRVVSLTWAVMEVAVQETTIKTHWPCQVRGRLLTPGCSICSLSRQCVCWEPVLMMCWACVLLNDEEEASQKQGLLRELL